MPAPGGAVGTRHEITTRNGFPSPILSLLDNTGRRDGSQEKPAAPARRESGIGTILKILENASLFVLRSGGPGEVRNGGLARPPAASAGPVRVIQFSLSLRERAGVRALNGENSLTRNPLPEGEGTFAESAPPGSERNGEN